LALQQGFFLFFKEEKLTMKIKAFLISIIVSLFTIIPILGQDNNDGKSKCDCDECHQFDFWIGEWKVQWDNSDGTPGEGQNIVNSILNGCVIEENFNGNPGVDFKGKSFSVYNNTQKIWQQTWVDDQGSYMVFTGGMEDDQMILSRKITRNKKELIQRMVFYNISKDEFDWNWESSKDDSKTWQLNWKLHYTRL
jgi:hypothetical protein